MSASNWAVCPRCASKRQGALDVRRADLQGMYGKVPVEEFDAARAELARDEAAPQEHTFREDYEIYGASTGTVSVTYFGSCQTCGLLLKFSHEHPLYSRATGES